MIALWLAMGLTPLAEAAPPLEGHRVAAVGEGSGIQIGQASVVGQAGGTHATTVAGRFGTPAFMAQVALPFTSFRVPGGRSVALGNLSAEGWYRFELGGLSQAAGLRAHTSVGNAYTWVNRPAQLWPSHGADLLWQGRIGLTEDVALVVQAAAGLHAPAAYAPFPRLFGRAEAAGAVDWSVHERVGLTGELAFAWWDLSPLEVTGLVRGELLPGLRARGGVVLPVGTWAGLQPTSQPRGLSEATLLLDLTLSR